jgi:hypothetical protein
VKVVVDVALTWAGRTAVALPTAFVGESITDLGAAPYALLNVRTVSQVVCPPPEPTVTVNEPAESVEPLVTAADGVVAQLVGVPIVGAFVCVDLKCALSSWKMANVLVVPLTFIVEFEVSALSKVSPLEFCIRKAIVELIEVLMVSDGVVADPLTV